MRRIILFSIVLGVLGLFLGYFLFGKFAGEYVKITMLISPPENFFENITQKVAGIEEIRQNILITGAGGLVLGVLLSLFLGKRR